MATIEDLREFQDEIKAKFGASAVVAYANVSRTHLSIARHYFGATVQGKHFVYNPADDSLIRQDVVKWIAKKRREAKARQRQRSAASNTGETIVSHTKEGE